jgi:glycosyltransferase involved in cell wall biosynthesis
MPRELPRQPDVIICPSALDHQYYPNGVVLPVPVRVPWRQRKRARTYIHNAGHGGLRGRNGTQELLASLRYIKSPIDLRIRSQKHIERGFTESQSKVKLDITVGTLPYDQLYHDGDVFLFPEKFNGLSLPLQEARAAGMLVMAGARFPMTTWLPTEPLIPVHHYQRSSVSPRCHEFDEAVYDPRDIAATIDKFYDTDITDYSKAGQEWADHHSWGALRGAYLEVLRP